MKKIYAVALFVAMAVLFGAVVSRAADDKAAMDLEPMRQKLCSGKGQDIADMLFSNVEFDIRVEFMMRDDVDETLVDVLAEARKQINSEIDDFDMKLDKCVLVKQAPMACEEAAREFAPLFASMYANEEETGPDSVEKFILAALEEMGITQCGMTELSATVGEGDMAETINVNFFIGNKPGGWMPLMEMDDNEASVEPAESQ